MIDGDAVRKARLRVGLKTQRELAEAVGCARATINRAERGQGGVSLLIRIARVLGVDPTTLMKLSELGAPPLTQDERAALAGLRKLRPALRAKAIGYLTGLADGGGAEEAASLGAELAGDLAATEETEVAQAAERQSKKRDTSA